MCTNNIKQTQCDNAVNTCVDPYRYLEGVHPGRERHSSESWRGQASALVSSSNDITAVIKKGIRGWAGHIARFQDENGKDGKEDLNKTQSKPHPSPWSCVAKNSQKPEPARQSRKGSSLLSNRNSDGEILWMHSIQKDRIVGEWFSLRQQCQEGPPCGVRYNAHCLCDWPLLPLSRFRANYYIQLWFTEEHR